ncbi:hypothetical protein [Subtercola boreus]|nr:hypothetical protein [Subtercola boreus]
MAQRGARLIRPGEPPAQPAESPAPVFALSVLGFAGITIPKAGQK